MSQRALFDLDSIDPVPKRGRLDADSEAFLVRYRDYYRGDRSDGALRGEVSQLRSLVREAVRQGGGSRLPEVLSNCSALAGVLTAPAKRPSAATALIRLGAINAALLFLFGEDEGRRRIDELDKALPKRAEAEWYQSGVILAGERARRRAQSPTIEPGDLLRIVEAAGARRRTALSLRDRLLVAVHCYSGLGAGEIRVLRWDDLRWESEGEAWSAAAARGTKRTRLAIFGPAASLMIRHRLEAEAFDEYAFANSRGETLTDRQVRRIVLAACSAAGFPHAARSTLMSASAAYLSAAWLRDHDVAFALGIADMRTINRLLKPHHKLAAQRQAHAPYSA